MSYEYNNGWGGCGCGGTVQYAPPACNPNFPTACNRLGSGTIQRVVGEDSAYCKYTVPTLTSNSLLTYNASTGLVNWADGSTSNPIYLGNGNQASSSSVGAIQGTTPTGQLVEFSPSISTQTQFPIVSPSSTTATWGTIENIVPNQGLVYKNSSGSVAQLIPSSYAAGNVVSFDTNGNPIVVAGTTINTSNAFIDLNGIKLIYNTSTTITVNYTSLVAQNGSGSKIQVNNSSPLTLNINSSGIGGIDTGTVSASTNYYVYATSASGTAGVIASLSPTSPTVASGTYYRIIGIFRTNSTSNIDPNYQQIKNIVNFGYTANQVILTQSYTSAISTWKYWGGTITVPAPYITRIITRFDIVGTQTSQEANIVFSTSSAYGTSGSTAYVLGITNEIFGAYTANTVNGASNNSVYATGTVVVPNNGVISYNIYTLNSLQNGTPVDSFDLKISGYELSFI